MFYCRQYDTLFFIQQHTKQTPQRNEPATLSAHMAIMASEDEDKRASIILGQESVGN